MRASLRLLILLFYCLFARPGQSQHPQNQPDPARQHKPLPGLKDWFLTTGDGKGSPQLYVREFGSGQDTIVMLHGGWGGEHGDFLEAVRPLEARYHFIFYDQRGSLRSPCPDSLITFTYHTDDFERLRSELKLAKVHLVGHSMGAVLACAYATKYPQRIKKLTLIAPAYLKYPTPKEEIRLQQQGYTALKPFLNRPEVTHELIKYGLTGNIIDLSSREATSQARINLARRMLYDVSKWSLMMGGGALYRDRVFGLTEASYPKSGWDYVQEFIDQTYAVGIIVGDHDFLDFGNLLIKKWVSDSKRIRLSIIENAGHIIWLDQPKEFTKQLVRHLSDKK